MKEEQFITREYLDEKFKEQAQIIIAAVDGVLDKRIEKTEENLKKEINNVGNSEVEPPNMIWVF